MVAHILLVPSVRQCAVNPLGNRSATRFNWMLRSSSLPIIIYSLAVWTVVGSFPSERISTAVTRPPFSGDMEDNRLSVTVAERRGSANVLHGQDFVPSSNPRGDDAPQVFCEHIRRSPRGSTFSTDRTLHCDLNRPRLHAKLPLYDQHTDLHCGLAYPLYTITTSIRI